MAYFFKAGIFSWKKSALGKKKSALWKKKSALWKNVSLGNHVPPGWETPCLGHS